MATTTPGNKAVPATTTAKDPAEAGTAILEAGVVDVRDEVKEKTASGEKKEKGGGFASYVRIFSYGTAFDYFLMVVCCLASMGSGVAMPLMNIVFGRLVGNFTDYFLPNTAVTKAQFQAELNKMALYIVYLFVGKLVLSYVALFCIRISGLRMSAAFRLAYLRALFAQPISKIDTVSPGKVSTRITTSSNTVQVAISQQFAMMFQSLAFTIGLFVVSFTQSWLLTLVAASVLPFIILVHSFILPPYMKINKLTLKTLEDASAVAYEIFSSIRIVVAFGAEEKLAGAHAELLENAAANEKKAAPLMGLLMAPGMMVMYGVFGLTFWFGIKRYVEGKIADVGVITVVLFSVMMAVMNMGRVAAPIIAIAKAGTAAAELFEIIDAPASNMLGLKDPEVSTDADIMFDNVAFSYPSRPGVQILNELSLTLEAGKVTAIVGPSGSGKSTIVGLVQRWYELLGTTAVIPDSKEASPVEAPVEVPVEEKPKKSRWGKSASDTKKQKKDDKKEDEQVELGPNTCTGAVKIGNVNLQDVDMKWWRSQIGLVQQEPFLFNDTLFNNVAFGLCGTSLYNLPKDQKMNMVQEACREACAEEFISKLPQGYETFVGESGIKLSGGQRQRIAIARSIVKQPPILILDEATSAIDVRTERIVQQALDRVSKNRTTIVIAHRLSTIRRADKIIVLRKGQLVEQGTHEELVAIETGVYRSLVHAQELAMEAHGNDIQSTPDDSVIHETKPTLEDAEVSEEKKEITKANPEYKEKGLLRSFGRLIMEQRGHWFLYIIASIGILVAGAMYPIQAYIFAQVIAVFTAPSTDQLVRDGNFWAGMFGVEAAVVGVAYFLIGYALHYVEVIVTSTYGQEYLENILRQRIVFFDDQDHSAGSLTARLSGDTMQLRQLLATEMSMALIAIVNLVGSLIISFVYGWKLTLVGLFSVLPVILAAGYMRVRLEMQFEQRNAKVFKESSQFASEAVGAFRTVVSLIMEDMVGDRYQMLLMGHVKHAFVRATWSTVVFAASDSLELACMALTFWYGGTLLATYEYNVVDFFIIYMAVVQGAVAAGMWFSIAPNMAQATAAANRILSMRTHKSVLKPDYAPLADASQGASIEFRNVDFTYKSRDVPVLSNLSLHIPAGKFAAIVGASGCGKSTTISLLERFYDPTSGTILFNDQPISHLPPSEYRAQISLVTQEPTLYEGTISDNIALSNPSAIPSQIAAAASSAQIHDFITSLPDGYATHLGSKGTSLSGGQKQRIALARALLRSPALLLLDEATSSLDSESEALVQGAIEGVAGGRTTVLAIAHRLATIQKADVIFVMGGGKVLEVGDHQELLRRRGVYWQMCQAQALDR